ncbi:MAG: rRNA maturation RNase YbeY [Ktedonobacteraceae bacterium]
MQEEHPQIELYIDTGNKAQNSAIEQVLAELPLDQVVKKTLQTAGIQQPIMLTLLITNDDSIRDMNKQYRQQDKATDVLSFPLLEQPLVNAPIEQLWTPAESEEGAATGQEKGPPAFVTPPELLTNLGDIVISWPTVERQAKEAGHSSSYEFLYLVAHGVLHLIGYDDQSEAGYQAMVAIQHTVLEAVGQKA